MTNQSGALCVFTDSDWMTIRLVFDSQWLAIKCSHTLVVTCHCCGASVPAVNCLLYDLHVQLHYSCSTAIPLRADNTEVIHTNTMSIWRKPMRIQLLSGAFMLSMVYAQSSSSSADYEAVHSCTTNCAAKDSVVVILQEQVDMHVCPSNVDFLREQ